MPKTKRKSSDYDTTSIIAITGYLLFCVWWQYNFVYPFIRMGDYWKAFDIFMGWNPITPIFGFFLLWLIGEIAGVVMRVWVFLFGE